MTLLSTTLQKILKHKMLLLGCVAVIIVVAIMYGAYAGIKGYVVKKSEERTRLEHTLALLEESIAKTQQDVKNIAAVVEGSTETSKSENLKLSQSIEVERKLRAQSESDLRVSLQTQKPRETTAVVNEWRPRIAHITCRWDSGNISIGSGLFLGKIDGVYKVETNRHVVYDEEGAALPTSCTIKLPEDSAVAGSELKISGGTSADSATIYISNPSTKMQSLASSILNRACTTRASVGQSIVVLGYPAIGSPQDITATEGIISGYDDTYYITSAKIEQGNSGGIAVTLKDNCIIGIPTLTRVGRIESLGRILDWKVIEVK